MSIVKIKDKTFETSISAEEIAKRVKELAQQLSKDFEGKNPLFLAVLNGSFIFAADLMREITIPCEISFVKLASYQGTTSTGKIKEVIDRYQRGFVRSYRRHRRGYRGEWSDDEADDRDVRYP